MESDIARRRHSDRVVVNGHVLVCAQDILQQLRKPTFVALCSLFVLDGVFKYLRTFQLFDFVLVNRSYELLLVDQFLSLVLMLLA